LMTSSNTLRADKIKTVAQKQNPKSRRGILYFTYYRSENRAILPETGLISESITF